MRRKIEVIKMLYVDILRNNQISKYDASKDSYLLVPFEMKFSYGGGGLLLLGKLCFHEKLFKKLLAQMLD